MPNDGTTWQSIFVDLVHVTCHCGTPFAIPRAIYDKAKSDSRTSFHCPKGHSCYYSESETDRQRRRAERAEQEKARLEGELVAAKNRADANWRAAEQQGRKAKSAKTRLKNVRTRIAHGVCPCCGRTFQNLQNHMKHMHPKMLPKKKRKLP
jgi:hypothetical protein